MWVSLFLQLLVIILGGIVLKHINIEKETILKNKKTFFNFVKVIFLIVLPAISLGLSVFDLYQEFVSNKLLTREDVFKIVFNFGNIIFLSLLCLMFHSSYCKNKSIDNVINVIGDHGNLMGKIINTINGQSDCINKNLKIIGMDIEQQKAIIEEINEINKGLHKFQKEIKKLA